MRFWSLVLTIILLIVFGEYAYATNPRKFGIGLRYGWSDTSTSFGQYIEDDADEKVNDGGTATIPLILQLDEDLVNNYSFTTWFVDLSRLTQTDHPPRLRGKNFSNLLGEKNYAVPTEYTYTNKFSDSYPQYSPVINNASNPSLSADYDVNQISFGKSGGIFYPHKEFWRLGTISLGLGLNYTEGNYQINLCDPYLISAEKQEAISFKGKFTKGYCLSKTELFSANVSNFSVALNFTFIFYSFVFDLSTVEIFKINRIYSLLSRNLVDKKLLKPSFDTGTTDIISVIIHF